MKKILITIMLLTSVNYASDFDGLGYFVSHQNLKRNYQLTDVDHDAQVFTDYILRTNNKISEEDALRISQEIIRISQCFDIDARMYLALIKMESLFSFDAISPTGAVGLTQFTSIGSREVSDQLGERGRDYANSRNTRYLNGIVQTCVNESWTQLWEQQEGWSAQRLLFLNDIELSLTYGATLLKVYLAKNYNEDIEKNYYDTLVNYNGEPGERKYWYARKILEYYDEI